MGITTTFPKALEDLGGVVISTLASGDLLRYNGTNWVDVAETTLPFLSTASGGTVEDIIYIDNSFGDTAGSIRAHDATLREILILEGGGGADLTEARLHIYGASDTASPNEVHFYGDDFRFFNVAGTLQTTMAERIAYGEDNLTKEVQSTTAPSTTAETVHLTTDFTGLDSAKTYVVTNSVTSANTGMSGGAWLRCRAGIEADYSYISGQGNAYSTSQMTTASATMVKTVTGQTTITVNALIWKRSTGTFGAWSHQMSAMLVEVGG